MKKLLLALAIMASTQSFAQMVSEEFEDDLKRRHPKATAVNWISGEEYYIAEFQEGDRQMKAFYSQGGEWVKTQRQITLDEVPEEIKGNVPAGFRILGAEKVVSSQTPAGNYLIKLEAAYDKKGKVLDEKEK